MSTDLTCPTCDGASTVQLWKRGWTPCGPCNASGRRRPELREWDALKDERDRAKEAVRNLDKALRNAVKERGDALDERDRYRAILAGLLECELCRSQGDTSPCGHWDWAFARAALDPDPDLAERTRRIRADE